MSVKEEILEQAAKLFYFQGFNNTSIQDILDASSVAKSNFYYHFDSKERLGFDVLERRVKQFNAFAIASSLDNPELTPKERLNAFLDKMLALADWPEGELGCPFGNLAQEMSNIHEPFRKALSEFFCQGAGKVEKCFEEGKRTGDFKRDLPSKRISEFIIAQIQGSILLRKTHKDIEILKGNMELLRRLITEWSCA